MKRTALMTFLSALLLSPVYSAPDPDFYIYLCFGQSNMEGAAPPEAVDRDYVDPRFQTMACVNFQNPSRTMGQWYTAYPPIVRQGTNVGMADYFGRTMVAALPSNVRVGVVDVAIGGTAIEGFMQDKVAQYIASISPKDQWLKDYFAAYDNDPYKRLVDMARKAQESGVIKGILLHQGESNNGDSQWLDYVKTIYERLLSDLNLNAADVPLFAGETVNADVGGACSYHNTVIARLPEVIPTAHVIPSTGCPCGSDRLHFTVSGYRTMGKRYAYQALRTMGLPTQAQSGYAWNAAQKKIYVLSRLDPVDDILLRVGGTHTFTVWGTFADGHRENLTAECQFTSSDFVLDGNTVITNVEKSGIVTAQYTDFTGSQHRLEISVVASASAPNHVLVVNNGTAGQNLWDKQAICTLLTPMVTGKTYVVRAQIRADLGGDCALWPIWDASPNRNQYGNSADVQYLDAKRLTPSYQQLTWEFTAQYPHDKLQFAFGLIGGKVCFDDVSCMEKGTAAEMVANGSFESDDLSSWAVISWAGQTMAIETDNTTGIMLPTERTPCPDDVIYDLSGRRVPSSALRPGLYIRQGKKYVNK